LYAFANGGATAGGAIGSVTDQYERDNITVKGSTVNVGALTWSPPTYANTLWQLGTADRKADEFNLGDAPRQYDLFNQVPADLTYTIGQSTEAKDWYYAQTKAGTWTIDFKLSKKYTGNGHLTVAFAGATRGATVDIGVNGTTIATSPAYPNDSAIYRSANQSGYYHLLTVNFAASLLKVGENTVTFNTAASGGSGVMYDTIKLEAD
jgi:rhamnogalacturonan endolyase